MTRLTVLLPALNEVHSIGPVIDSIQAEEKKAFYASTKVNILVADSGSVNGTKELVIDKGCKIVHGDLGKGNVVRYALQFLKDEDYVLMIDSDGTYSTRNLHIVIDSMRTFEVVSGTRLKGVIEPGAMTSLNKLGNKFLTGVANCLYSKKTTDLCTGYWIFTKKALEELNLTAKGFELEANIFVEINKKNLNYGEVPIVYQRRTGDPAKLKVRNGWIILWTLIKGKLSK